MDITLDTVAQAGIFVFAVSALFLISRKNKWGFVLGLLSQPFWYYTAYHHKQWGIFFLNFVYTVVWSYGFYQWWIKDGKVLKKEKPNA